MDENLIDEGITRLERASWWVLEVGCVHRHDALRVREDAHESILDRNDLAV